MDIQYFLSYPLSLWNYVLQHVFLPTSWPLKNPPIISTNHIHMGMWLFFWHGQPTGDYTTKEKWLSLSQQPSTAVSSQLGISPSPIHVTILTGWPPNLQHVLSWELPQPEVDLFFMKLIRLRSWRDSNLFPLETSIWKQKVVISLFVVRAGKDFSLHI